jgi:large subunit ribosomal protein L17
MKHGIRKIKFTKGQDAHQMLMKKMIFNFFTHGSLTSTEKKIKALKPLIDKITYKAQKDRVASRRALQRYFSSEKTANQVYALVTEKPKVAGSVTRILKLNRRDSDGAQMSQLQWVTQSQREVKEPQNPKKKKTNGEKKPAETKPETKPETKQGAEKKDQEKKAADQKDTSQK